MNSISIVNTQMQLINSVEAVVAYGSDNNWLINGNLAKQRNEQIDTFYRSHSLKRYFNHYINLRLIKSDKKLSLWVNLIYSKIVICYLNFVHKVDFAIIGHYLNPLHRYLLRIARTRNGNCKEILVDDGTGTMLFARERSTEKSLGTDRVTYDRSSMLLFKPNNTVGAIPKHLEYFTIYPLGGILYEDSVRINHYDVVKSWGGTYGIEILPRTMIIVGQTLVEENILSIDNYRKYLSDAFSKAHDNYNIEHIIYCPHPGEKQLEKKLQNLSGLVIYKNKVPFELFALSFPSDCVIAGFFSSSLWNLIYFGIKLPIRYIDLNADDIECGEPMKSHIINVYRTYSSNVNLSPL